jgi:membrane associated rhomboid family serine protease
VPFTEMTVMIAVVAAMVLGFIHLVRLVGTLILHRTVRKVVEKDPASAEAFIAQLTQPAPRTGDDRLSVILIAFGIAMIAASLVIGDPHWMHYAIAGALFPLIVGTALWLRLFLIERARRRGAQQ